MNSELINIFKKLKKVLKKYEKSLVPNFDTDNKYDLWSHKNITIGGRKRKEVFFASIVIQNNYVGFHYMPVYVKSELKEVFQPELLKLLKGKSCFHIKKLNATLEKQVKEALKKGFDIYKKRGWI